MPITANLLGVDFRDFELEARFRLAKGDSPFLSQTDLPTREWELSLPLHQLSTGEQTLLGWCRNPASPLDLAKIGLPQAEARELLRLHTAFWTMHLGL